MDKAIIYSWYVGNHFFMLSTFYPGITNYKFSCTIIVLDLICMLWQIHCTTSIGFLAAKTLEFQVYRFIYFMCMHITFIYHKVEFFEAINLVDHKNLLVFRIFVEKTLAYVSLNDFALALLYCPLCEPTVFACWMILTCLFVAMIVSGETIED